MSQRSILAGIAFVMILGIVQLAGAANVARTLSWQAVTTNADGTPAVVTGYTMYRSSDNGVTFTKQIPNTGASVVTWTDTNVPTGNICYEVTALNAAGESTRSNRVCFSMPSAVPQAPTGLQVSGALAAIKAPSHSKKK